MPHIIARSKITGEYCRLDNPDAAPELISGELRKVTFSYDNQVGHVVAVDYIPVEHLEAVVSAARAKGQDVTVGGSHDSGPGGDLQHHVDDDHPAVVALTQKVS